MNTLTRREQIEAQIAECERKLEDATAAWTNAKFNRDPVQIQETENRLIELTTELNVLKMKRPV